MTLLIDPGMLFSVGYGLGRIVPHHRTANAVGAVVTSAVVFSSVATYCNAPFMRSTWEKLGGRTGKDLILNSWVLHLDSDRPSMTRELVAAALFASYPAWLIAGVRRGRAARAR